MTKLTKEQIEQIKSLYSTGKYFQYELAEEYKTSQSVICYHVNPEYRIKKIECMKRLLKKQRKKGESWNQKNPEKQKKYMRKYMRERYQSDPKFRRRILDKSMECAKKRIQRSKANE